MDDYTGYVQSAVNTGLREEDRKQAFSELVVRFQDMAYACALGVLGDPITAQDATQEALISAWRHLHKLKNPKAFPSWLRQRVVWRCWYYGRSGQSDMASSADLMEQIPDDMDLETAVARNDVHRKMHRLIEALPGTAREILTLHYLNEYSHMEIAHFLNLTEGTVRKRLHDARNRLKAPLERLMGEVVLQRAPSRKPKIGANAMKKDTTQNYPARTPEDVIAGMIKPAWCEKTETGRLTWKMFCTAIRNDTDTLKHHLEEDKSRAQLEFWYTPPIYFAVREGALEAVKILWEAYHYDEVTELIQMAVDRGYDDVANYLRDEIDSGDEVDLRLHEAIEANNEKEALQLLTAHPDLVNQRDPRGVMPLHGAVLKRQKTLVKQLLDVGAPVDAVDHGGFRPIHYVYWNNIWWGADEDVDAAPELIKMLIDAGARDTITLATARNDRDTVAQFLEEASALANDGDTLEKRPVSAAAERGFHDIARLLVEHGADPNLREGRWCPFGSGLMFASVQNDLEMAEILLDAGADPNGGIDSSGTPANRAETDAMRALMYAYGGRPNNAWGYIQQGNLETVAVILAYKPDPFSEETAEYLTTPYSAVVSGHERKNRESAAHEAIFDMLLKRKYPMPEVLTECKSYLFGDGPMERKLLESGLNPNLPDWQRRTPLHDLAKKSESDDGAIATADMLLEFGADINAIDEADRSTPLGIAAKNGNLRMVQYLLEKGADPNKAGSAWATPLVWAERRGHGEIVEVLKGLGD